MHAAQVKCPVNIDAPTTLPGLSIDIGIHAWKRGPSLLVVVADDLKPRQGRVAELYVYDNFARVPAESVMAGDICALTGLGDVTIGETICDKDEPTALPTITVSSLASAPGYPQTVLGSESFCSRSGALECSEHDHGHEKLHLRIQASVG